MGGAFDGIRPVAQPFRFTQTCYVSHRGCPCRRDVGGLGQACGPDARNGCLTVKVQLSPTERTFEVTPRETPFREGF